MAKPTAVPASAGADPDAPPLWSGCHASFAEVPAASNAYDGERWAGAVAERAARWQRVSAGRGPLPPEPDRPSGLPMVLGSVNAAVLSVLDVGGGGANAFFHVRASVSVPSLRWTVVERPGVCAAVARIPMPHEVRFESAIPEETFDVVFFGSSLQYFDDWRGTLRRAARAAGRFLLLEDVPLVRGPTFAAAQRYFDGAIPAWFLNHEELLSVVRDEGLHLAAWDRYRARILGRWDGFPMDNYPPEMRVGLPSALLFRAGL